MSVDKTNLTAGHRKAYIQMFKAAGYEIKSLNFNSPIDACFARNETREDKPPIPKVALITSDKRQTAPQYTEGFDQISVVPLDSRNDSYTFVEI